MRTNGCVLLCLLSLSLSGCLTLHSRHDTLGEPTFIMGSPSDARWSASTWEAASSPGQRRLLERARPATVLGEIVEISGFLQLREQGEAHRSCGQSCVRHGQPIGLLTDRGRLYLILPEEHEPRRAGEVDIRERFAEFMGRRVRISGMETRYGNYQALFVRTLPTEP